jgi:hypothetical protein
MRMLDKLIHFKYTKNPLMEIMRRERHAGKYTEVMTEEKRRVR